MSAGLLLVGDRLVHHVVPSLSIRIAIHHVGMGGKLGGEEIHIVKNCLGSPTHPDVQVML